ncbi:hypothetical protein [Pseudomonas marginalis]|uniref:hypothetical protein n=1 Tax=Pseudomonas marginalis TaxID=298 RepID=UPI00203366C0|nr:hypothetical protein [Pseudomonas marginalis]MCM2376868.1 hypothetical protein [Pseudomonas marginalis]
MSDLASTLTGQDVVDAFKADIEDFFETGYHFELRVETLGVTPTCKGSGPTARIQLPVEMLEKAVDSFEDLALLLLILGHETAHYLHRHNEHRDESVLESRALEVWADYFGTKLAMVVMTIGDKTLLRFGDLPGAKNAGSRLDALASALATLSCTYFNITSPKYPPANERVSTCISGMLSFFEVQFGLQAGSIGGEQAYRKAIEPRTIIDRALKVQKRLYANRILADLAEKSPSADGEHEELHIIRAVHIKIQDGQPALFEGLKVFQSLWLSLDYDIPPEVSAEIAKRKRELLISTLSEMGISTEMLNSHLNPNS